MYKMLTAPERDLEGDLEDEPDSSEAFNMIFERSDINAPEYKFDESRIKDEYVSFYLRHVQLANDATSKELCFQTVGQSNNSLWFLERRFRITASRAHRISRARHDKTRLKYFFEKKVDNTNFLYGRDLESKARNCYREKYQKDVIEVGLAVRKEAPFVGASPDGIIIENQDVIVLEIKCPKRCEKANIDVDYVNEYGELSKKHEYYTQVQLQIFCCNATKCHFFIYSEADSKLVVVDRDQEFIYQMLSDLENVYTRVLLPAIVSNFEDP
jgi:putative phage-type endonuclease